MLSVSHNIEEGLESALANFPDQLAQALVEKSAELAQALSDKIRFEKLNGGVLNDRSGALAAAIKVEPLSGAQIGFLISARGVAYAGAQEYGFNGSEAVSAYSRTVHQAFGRAITAKTTLVQSFSRQMNLPERSYMRSSLEEMAPDIESALQDVVIKISKEALSP